MRKLCCKWEGMEAGHGQSQSNDGSDARRWTYGEMDSCPIRR